jgi:broad specificity phosphatase PhoE
MAGRAAPLLILVKHAQPVLDATTPPREWELARAGEVQAERLADALRRYLPFELVCSPEIKARRTSEIVAARLGIPTTTVEDLRELDRPALPIMTDDEHAALNARVFVERDRAVIGDESASSALRRFDQAVLAISSERPRHNLVVIAHGTVISLFVASANPSVDAFSLWKGLGCPSMVILDRASLAFREVVDKV